MFRKVLISGGFLILSIVISLVTRQCYTNNTDEIKRDLNVYEREKGAANELQEFKKEADDIRSNTDTTDRYIKARDLLRSVIENQ